MRKEITFFNVGLDLLEVERELRIQRRRSRSRNKGDCSRRESMGQGCSSVEDRGSRSQYLGTALPIRIWTPRLGSQSLSNKSLGMDPLFVCSLVCAQEPVWQN
jgi:hypothetical protein